MNRPLSMLRFTSRSAWIPVLMMAFSISAVRAELRQADVIIYGGTSSGIAAAVQVTRLGKTVIVVEPSHHLGGLTTGGLGQTDIGNKVVIGGIAREFYQEIKKIYADDARWKFQKRSDYRHGSLSPKDDAQWTFEPHVASEVYAGWITQNKMQVFTGQRLVLTKNQGVKMQGGRIQQIVMESGDVFAGKMFIDASYEGDLLAMAGVKYTVGREANAQYGETVNGVQAKGAHSHQFGGFIDPYVKKGDATSGLLPGIDANGPGIEGAGDQRVQAYCFRMCLTNAPENRLPIEKPAGYNERDYEMLLRYAESDFYTAPAAKYDPMPNAKTDTNNSGAVSTDFIGQNYAYPDGSYQERAAIIEQHRVYQLGYLWTLQNHPRLPDRLKQFYRQWGLPKDEFQKTDHWTPQLYIREARRMVGAVVMTQKHCEGRDVVADSVGMGAYNMDSHHVQRYVDEKGGVRNEGDIQLRVPTYPISYRAIIPRKEECENLLVPICLSASHMAFGSIRMEPVFMVLGQSSATAACLAIDAGVALSALDYPTLQKRLLADGQVLEYKKPATSKEKK